MKDTTEWTWFAGCWVKVDEDGCIRQAQEPLQKGLRGLTWAAEPWAPRSLVHYTDPEPATASLIRTPGVWNAVQSRMHREFWWLRADPEGNIVEAFARSWDDDNLILQPPPKLHWWANPVVPPQDLVATYIPAHVLP